MEYRFGPFRLDAAKRRLWRGDDLVPLTPKAIETLLVLVAHAGRVVEKDEILKACWPDTFVEEATLAQNVSTLRKALGDTDPPTYIGTVPRRGHRFLEPVAKIAQVTEASEVIETASAGAQSDAARKNGERLWMAVSALLAVALAAVGTLSLRTMSRSTAARATVPVVFSISPPEGTSFSRLAVS